MTIRDLIKYEVKVDYNPIGSLTIDFISKNMLYYIIKSKSRSDYMLYKSGVQYNYLGKETYVLNFKSDLMEIFKKF